MADSKVKTKQLLKILFGAAWIDGVMQPEERTYLQRLAETYQMTEDPDIKSLLMERKVMEQRECYVWLEDYLGKNHTEADYHELLEAVSALVYSDSSVETPEARLLTKLQELDPGEEHPQSRLEKMLGKVQRIYRDAIMKQSGF